MLWTRYQHTPDIDLGYNLGHGEVGNRVDEIGTLIRDIGGLALRRDT